MTNEEIRKRIKPFMNVMDGYRYDVPEAEQIQNETRKDEREKVIEEIRECAETYIYTDDDGNNLTDFEELIEKLNSLKQC